MKQEDNLECINGYIPFPLESDYRIQINSKPMNKLQINGVDVLFPYVPYPSQEAYMNEVISSLQNESHALLESPTGTGKTLCLLCATLGYLVHCQKYKLKFGFKIIYATRTHSQISQVIKELKKTAYEPFIVIMGGRDKMCMDNKLNTSIEDANVNCHAALSHQKCKYYDSKREKKDPFYFKKVMDIYDLEDFRNYCAAYKVCPYFYSKEFASECDLLFIPYNYIINKEIRKKQKLDIANSIVIFDEAHNIPKEFEMMETFDITVNDLHECIKELDYIQTLSRKSDDITLEVMLSKLSEDILTILKKPIDMFIDFISQVKIESKKGIQILGEGVLQYFNNAIRNGDTLIDKWFFEYYDWIKTASSIAVYTKHSSCLKKWRAILNTVYNSIYSNQRNRTKYLWGTTSADYGISINDQIPFNKPYLPIDPGSRKFSLICFNAAVAFHNFLSCTHAKSVIFTSGTLSPLDYFERELNIKFTYKLESPHIIKPDQVMAGILTHSNNKIPYYLNNDNNKNEEIISSVLDSIQQLVKNVKGGTLIFFPSYSLLERYYKVWCSRKANETSIKHFIEAKDSDSNQQVMSKYHEYISSYGQAILFAVCRGKISEGCDFPDDFARLAICVGIPYADCTDTIIDMKRQYLSKVHKIMSPGDWYTMDAIKALNQCIGRVIRHQFDYGYLVFIDIRMPKFKHMLPKFVRDRIDVYDSTDSLKKSLNSFYDSCLNNRILASHKKEIALHKEKTNLVGKRMHPNWKDNDSEENKSESKNSSVDIPDTFGPSYKKEIPNQVVCNDYKNCDRDKYSIQEIEEMKAMRKRNKNKVKKGWQYNK